MKCETPARDSGSSREPAPTQKPSATERTPGTRSEITRSPVLSWLSSCLDTRRIVSLGYGKTAPPLRSGSLSRGASFVTTGTIV
jgi:hypothetical protein